SVMRKHLNYTTFSLLILFLIIPVILLWLRFAFNPFGKNDSSFQDSIVGISLGFLLILSLIFAFLSIRIKKTILGFSLILFNLILLGIGLFIMISLRM